MKKFALMWAQREALQDQGNAILQSSPQTLMIHYGDDPTRDRVLVYLISDLLPRQGFNGFVRCEISNDTVSFVGLDDSKDDYVEAIEANLACVFASEIKARG